MKTLTVVALVVLSQAGFAAGALAQGCSDKTKISCAEGMAWDDERRICAPKPSA